VFGDLADEGGADDGAVGVGDDLADVAGGGDSETYTYR
jgi:hypothetical protein